MAEESVDDTIREIDTALAMLEGDEEQEQGLGPADAGAGEVFPQEVLGDPDQAWALEQEGDGQDQYLRELVTPVTLNISEAVLDESEEGQESAENDPYANLLNDMSMSMLIDAHGAGQDWHDAASTASSPSTAESLTQVHPESGYELALQQLPGGDYYFPLMMTPSKVSHGSGENPLRVLSKIFTSTSQDDLRRIMTIPEEQAHEKMESIVRTPNQDEYFAIQEFETNYGETYVPESENRAQRCPSVETFFQFKAVVHLYLQPGHRMMSKNVRLDSSVFQLQEAVARFCGVSDPRNLDLYWKNNLLPGYRTLEELGVRAGQKVKMIVRIVKRCEGKRVEKNLTGKSGLFFRDPFARLEEREDTVRKVWIEQGPGQDDPSGGGDASGGNNTQEGPLPLSLPPLPPPKMEITLTTVHPLSPKPMLGGFTNNRTSLSFHEASTQMPPFTPYLDPVQPSKAIQAFGDALTMVQTGLPKYTQMEKRGYYVSNVKDTVLFPQKYETYEELMIRKEAAALIIQRYWRRELAKKELQRRKKSLLARVEFVEQLRKGKIEERMRIMDEEFRRQQCPSRLVDLELLYREIVDWRKKSETFISENRWGAERRAALAVLTETESDLLLKLETTRQRIITKGKDRFVKKQLDEMGNPKRWFSSKTALFISIDTEGRQRSRKLHEYYDLLKAPVENSKRGNEKRLKLIKCVHKMILEEDEVKKGAIPMAEMLLQLFLREIKFMANSACIGLLPGIRKRIATTFFCLCKDVVFNEEAKRLDPIPFDISKLQKNLVRCQGCKRTVYREQLTVLNGTTVTKRCQSCTTLFRRSIQRVDLNLYRKMLKELREEEFVAGVLHSMAFLIDAFDMRLIVEQIWLGQSALSGCDNRYLLRLTRWKKEMPWSPWNCILLTEEEAATHGHIEDLSEAYQPTLLQRVRVKHETSRIYFAALAKFGIKLNENFDTTCTKFGDFKAKRTAAMSAGRKRKGKGVGPDQGPPLTCN